jgi:peptidoglycan/xylan/chitin deacetylase (PgdA/CDA1 family)
MKFEIKKLQNTLTIISLMILLSFSYSIRQKRENVTTQPPVSDKTEISTNNPELTTPTNGAETKVDDTKSNEAQKRDASIPILMYHYIRVVTDPNDELGFNLSVTPDKFAKDLDYLQDRGYTTINFSDIENGNIPEKSIILTFDDGYEDFYRNAYPELKKRGMTAVSFIIVNKNSEGYMKREEIKELSDNGIEIGSHTLSHPDLSTLTKERAKKEITESKTKLEEIINRKVISLCYPSGKFTEETSDIAKEADYQFATTTKSGIGQFKTPFSLSRYRMGPNTDISRLIK